LLFFLLLAAANWADTPAKSRAGGMFPKVLKKQAARFHVSNVYSFARQAGGTDLNWPDVLADSSNPLFCHAFSVQSPLATQPTSAKGIVPHLRTDFGRSGPTRRQHPRAAGTTWRPEFRSWAQSSAERPRDAGEGGRRQTYRMSQAAVRGYRGTRKSANLRIPHSRQSRQSVDPETNPPFLITCPPARPGSRGPFAIRLPRSFGKAGTTPDARSQRLTAHSRLTWKAAGSKPSPGAASGTAEGGERRFDFTFKRPVAIFLTPLLLAFDYPVDLYTPSAAEAPRTISRPKRLTLMNGPFRSLAKGKPLGRRTRWPRAAPITEAAGFESLYEAGVSDVPPSEGRKTGPAPIDFLPAAIASVTVGGSDDPRVLGTESFVHVS